MKVRILSLLVLALAMVLAVPARAQSQSATIEFRLTVTVACPNATYFGLLGIPNSDGFPTVQLSDGDGDGVFTGSTSAPTNDAIAILQLIQGTGTKVIEPPTSGPQVVAGDPSRVVRALEAPITLAPNQQYVFESSVSSCVGAALPPTGVSDGGSTVVLLGSAFVVLVAGAYVQDRARRAAA